MIPFRPFLESATPKIISAAGNTFSLFFNFFALKITWCWLGFYNYILLYRQKKINLFYTSCTILLLGTAILWSQSRGIYLALITVLIFLMLADDRASKKILLYVLLAILCLYLLPLLGLEMKGRVGYVSVNFFMDHLMSAVPNIALTNPELTGPAGSAQLRISWWTQIVEESLTSVKIFLFGKGFGMPLTQFSAASDIIAREPHNMYISIFARLGIVGLLIWIWMHITFFKAWRKSYKYAVANNLSEKYILLFLIIYIILILVLSFGESILIYPCHAVPYYFFWGVILRISFNLEMIQNEKNQ